MWVVRCEGGDLHDTFMREGYVAVGHLDDLSLDAEYLNESEDWLELHDQFKQSKYREGWTSDASIRNTFYQAFRFSREIKVGDIVVVPTSKNVSFGKIESTNLVKSQHYSHRIYRNVSWGPCIERDELPLHLKRSMWSSHTVFNVDDYLIDVYHLLYPWFVIGDELRISLNVTNTKSFNSVYIGRIIDFISEIELISKEHINSDSMYELGIEGKLYEKLSEEAFKGNLTSSVRVNVRSPGDVQAVFDNIPRKWIIIYIVFSMVFGDTPLAENGLVDHISQDEIEAITKFIEKRWENMYGSEIGEDLGLELPDYDTGPLEDQQHRHNTVISI